MVASFLSNVTKFTAASAGTGSFVVSTPVTGYQSPATAGAVTAATYSYRAESSDLTQWEIGTGVYTSSNTTLTRSPTINSVAGTSAISFTLAPTVGFVGLTPDIVRPYYFSASLSSNQVTSGTSFNKVNCNTELADSNNWYDNATNFRFTPQFAGKYEVYAQVQATGTTVTELDAEIQKNGTTYVRTVESIGGSPVVITTQVGITIDFNGTTDFVELYCSCIGTGATNFLGGSAPIRTFFEARYVGV